MHQISTQQGNVRSSCRNKKITLFTIPIFQLQRMISRSHLHVKIRPIVTFNMHNSNANDKQQVFNI